MKQFIVTQIEFRDREKTLLEKGDVIPEEEAAKENESDNLADLVSHSFERIGLLVTNLLLVVENHRSTNSQER